MFRFATPRATAAARKFFGGKPFERIFILSRLPATDSARTATIRQIRSFGVNHIIEFKTILDDLIEWVQPQPDYDSDFLQALRIVKNYGHFRINDGPPANKS